MATATKTRKRRKRGKVWTRSQLVTVIEKARAEKGKELSKQDFAKGRYGLPTYTHVVREFGSLDAITVNPELETVLETAVNKPESWSTFTLSMTKQGVPAEVSSPQIENLTKMAQFLGDGVTADILNQARELFADIPKVDKADIQITAGDTTLTVTAV